MSKSPVAFAQVAGNSRRSSRFSQPEVLTEALGRVRGERDIAVFNLDSTLLDNRTRQARIVREARTRHRGCSPAEVHAR